nr:unnamed protein product [Spirometra erinaceieuropaei]
MCSTVSGLVAELVVQQLEKIAFVQNEPVFWRRHVDDTFVHVKKDMLQHFRGLFGAVFPDTKFTREEEQEQQFPSPNGFFFISDVTHSGRDVRGFLFSGQQLSTKCCIMFLKKSQSLSGSNFWYIKMTILPNKNAVVTSAKGRVQLQSENATIIPGDDEIKTTGLLSIPESSVHFNMLGKELSCDQLHKFLFEGVF